MNKLMISRVLSLAPLKGFSRRRHLVLQGIAAIAAFSCAVDAHAEKILSANIAGVWIYEENQSGVVLGSKGSAYLQVDRTYPLDGICNYSGAVNSPSGWLLQFNVERESFKSMLAVALAAQATGRSVRIRYDDAFGNGPCHVIGLITE
jgi:hypothetical protein